jgi:6-pyruvoyl-tetrahydropterin synthase
MHLNCDVEDFEGLNPSTENIARQAYRRLTEPIAEQGAELVSVRVWETDRTACTYRGEAAE